MTKKGKRTFAEGWQAGGKVAGAEHVYLGGCARMDAEAALQKPRR